MADSGWITGHSNIIYGPLANGCFTFMFESVPTYPDPGRYWDMIQRHKITQFYTAPTAIRTLMRSGKDWVQKYDRSSLRALGTAGEPINPEAWYWFYDEVGEKRCSIVDIFWQTVTGGHMMTLLPGSHVMKPGYCCLPFFEVKPVVLNLADGGGNALAGVLVFTSNWKSMLRMVYGDHQRFLDTYLRPCPGYYLTGDGCVWDKDRRYWVTGRIDDEAKGLGLFCYATLNEGIHGDEALMKEIKAAVRQEVGPFAMPDEILFTEESFGRPHGSCTWQDRILEQTMESADALNLLNHSNQIVEVVRHDLEAWEKAPVVLEEHWLEELEEEALASRTLSQFTATLVSLLALWREQALRGH